MKEKLFKVGVLFLLVVSLGCNAFLLREYMSDEGTVTGTGNVQEVTYDVKSDLTDVIAKAKECTVGVAVYQGNRAAGSGSGVVYKKDGNTVYVITNHHVIDKAQSIEVIFSSGESVSADLIGSDQYGDIAVLKMTVDFDVHVYAIGDSDKLDTGEVVLAVGSPLGIEYAGTVTKGIVSAPSRTVPVDLNSDGSDDWDMTVIQTDAAINPGNSGGALFNAAGEVIGINSAKMSSTSIEGMGYAISVDSVMDIIDNLSTQITRKQLSEDERGYLGINGTTVNSQSAEIYGLQVGVLIRNVTEGSAAMNAGLQVRDILTSFDGKSVDSMDRLRDIMSYYEVGETVEVEYYHLEDGEYVQKTTIVTLKAKPES